MTTHIFGNFIHGSNYVDYCFYVDYCTLTRRKKSKKTAISIFHGNATTTMLKETS